MEDLNAEYLKRQPEIKKALDDFRKIKQETPEKIFQELCFCLLTPQSKAFNCWEAILQLKNNGSLYTGSEGDIKNVLHRRVRFHNNKAKYIVETRKLVMGKGFDWKNFLSGEPIEMRGWLVENVKGMGYKEASHFLRNIGFRDLAILDRHILRNLAKYQAIKEVPKTLGRKQYMEIEGKFKEFSKKVGIRMDELDLLFWSMQAGKVFK